MKVTVEEKKEEKIDFSIAGQYLISTDSKRLVLTTGKSDKDNLFFEGVAINEEKESDIRIGQIHNKWNGYWFRKFNGTITIEQ